MGDGAAVRLLVIAPDEGEGGGPAAAFAEALSARGHDVETLGSLDNKVHAANLYRESTLTAYQLANGRAYHEAYEMAALLPGLVLLPEPVLDGLVRGLLHEGDPNGVRARREARLAKARLAEAMPGLPELERTPWAAHIARRSRGVILPTAEARDYFRAFGCRTPLFVASESDPGAYERAVTSTIDLMRDPARRPLARWAQSLVEVGADTQTPSQGMGVRYVEAVREFTPE